jgi:hypothetical protein
MRDEIELSGIVTVGMQIRALDAVLARVARDSAAGRTPVVQIDLDLAAIVPARRTAKALEVAGRRFDIEEFVDPGLLPILPGYTAEAWRAFVDAMGLAVRYPGLSWYGPTGRGAPPGPFATFHSAYWTTDWLAEDEPTPGLGEFHRRVEDLGGKVVFQSGRWLDEHVTPSLEVLRRAGIPGPLLMIGNPRHEDLVGPGEVPLSDAEIKRDRQRRVRDEVGNPVAVFDDREANRLAIIEANEGRGGSVLGVGIAIPGFSHDPATAAAALRVSTFEGMTVRGPCAAREPYLHGRYPAPADGGPYLGLWAGLGRNLRGYVLPRARTRRSDPSLPAGPAPFAEMVRANAPGSLAEDRFVDLAGRTIPGSEWERIQAVICDAEAAARQGLASPFPDDEAGRRALRRALTCSWLHSRDVEFVMTALNYPLSAAGRHDMEEDVPARDVLDAIAGKRAQGHAYSGWLIRWLDGLDPGGVVNVGFLNPHLTVSTWRWHPDDPRQDAMDVHRASSHHQGDLADRYDPIEATVNNLLHAREGIDGIQKTPVESWAVLESRVATRADARALAKSDWGASFLPEVVDLLRALEEEGWATPWGLVEAPTNGATRTQT